MGIANSKILTGQANRIMDTNPKKAVELYLNAADEIVDALRAGRDYFGTGIPRITRNLINCFKVYQNNELPVKKELKGFYNYFIEGSPKEAYNKIRDMLHEEVDDRTGSKKIEYLENLIN